MKQISKNEINLNTLETQKIKTTGGYILQVYHFAIISQKNRFNTFRKVEFLIVNNITHPLSKDVYPRLVLSSVHLKQTRISITCHNDCIMVTVVPSQ
jgi:hypothetical protein